MISIVLIASILSIAFSCQYFELGGGPAVPCDVCFRVEAYTSPSLSASYKFTCDSATSIRATGYSDSKCKEDYGGDFPISGGGLSVSTSGGVCNHITFRSYVGDSEHQGTACTKQDQIGYWEFGFVEGCFNVNNAPQPYSADLSCTSTSSFDIKIYDEYDCGGDELYANHTTISTGCQKSNETINIGAIIDNIFPNASVNFATNQTYFEISECGGAWPLWATILIVVGSVLCCCGCCAALGWIFCRRRKGGMNSGYVQTYQ